MEEDASVADVCKAAFDKLCRAAAGEGTSTNSDLPPCLQALQCNYTAKIPCLTCGKLFKSAHDIWLHSRQHGDPDLTGCPYSSGQLPECCFCGLECPSYVSLAVHQMSKKSVVHTCSVCETHFNSDQAYFQHMCIKRTAGAAETRNHFFTIDLSWGGGGAVKGYRGQDDVVCPLGCPATRPLPRSQLGSHLRILHGCDEEDVVNGTVCTVEPEFMAFCQCCGIKINTLKVPLVTHLVHQCFCRGLLQQELLRNLTESAQERNIDPDVIVRLELESFITDLMLYSSGNLTSDQNMSSIYSLLMPEMPEDEAELRKALADLSFVFRLWCLYIDLACGAKEPATLSRMHHDITTDLTSPHEVQADVSLLWLRVPSLSQVRRRSRRRLVKRLCRQLDIGISSNLEAVEEDAKLLFEYGLTPIREFSRAIQQDHRLRLHRSKLQ